MSDKDNNEDHHQSAKTTLNIPIGKSILNFHKMVSEEEDTEMSETEKNVAMAIEILISVHSNLGVLRQEKKIQDRQTTKSLKFQQFWNSKSHKEKKELLEVDLHDLLAYFESKNLEKDIIMQAFSYAKNHGGWKYWICSSCDERFPDWTLHFQHVLKKHVGVLSRELQSVIPVPIELSTYWESMLHHDTWTPMDQDSAFPIFEGQGGNLSFSRKKRDLPLCNNPERKDLLQHIHQMLVMLQDSEFLAEDHLNVVIEYALRRLRRQFPGVSLSELGLDSSYLCICFLDASELENILKFLKMLFDRSRSLVTENNKSQLGTYQYTSKVLCDTKDRIVLKGYLLCLHVNENSISGDSTSDIYNDDEASATLCLDSDNEGTGQPNQYDLLSWMFTNPPCEEKVKFWQYSKELRKDGGKELHRILHKNFLTLSNMLDANINLLSYIEALQVIWGYLCSELQDRRNNVVHVQQSFDTILRQLKKELVGSRTSMHTTMLKVIPPILRNARLMHEPTLMMVAPDSCDLLAFEDDDETMQNFLNQEDTCIKEEIKRFFEDFNLKLMANYSLITATLKERERLGLILNPSAAADYREILSPILKLYIQAKLEKLVDENATEMPEAAKEEDYVGDAELDNEKDKKIQELSSELAACQQQLNMCSKRNEVTEIAPGTLGSGYAPPTQFSSLINRGKDKSFTMANANYSSLQKQHVPHRSFKDDKEVTPGNLFGVSYSKLGLILPAASLCLDRSLTCPSFRQFAVRSTSLAISLMAAYVAKRSVEEHKSGWIVKCLESV